MLLNKYQLEWIMQLQFFSMQSNKTKITIRFQYLEYAQVIKFLGIQTSNYDQNILRAVHGEQYVINSIQIKQKNSLIFKNWQQKHFKAAEERIYLFDHNWAIYKQYFDTNKYLQEFWNVILTSTSSQGQEFISAWQAKSYPIYSIQFHPEQTLFNWDYEQQKNDIIVSYIQLI